VNKLRKTSIYVIAIMMMVATIGAASAVVQTSGMDSLSVGGATSGEHNQNVDITVDVTNASGIGALGFDVLFDPSVLTVNTVTMGPGLIGGLMSNNTDNVAGKEGIGGISTTGMSGTGNVVTINFLVVGNAPATTDIKIANLELQDTVNQNVTRRPNITNGVFTVTRQITPPTTFSISGFKISSTNNTGISGWPISLTNGTITLNTNTGIDGKYVFPNLVNGTYTVTEGNMPGWTPVGPTTLSVTINGANVTNKNFTNTPIQPPTTGGTLQGKVFNDLDKDKKLDKGERGIDDVVVQLTGDDKKTKKIKLKTKTNKNGNYIFSNLPNGKYKVHVETKHGWSFTTSTSKEITIKNGNVVTVNFGEKLNKKKDDEKHK
jgi:hypothetical protein